MSATVSLPSDSSGPRIAYATFAPNAGADEPKAWPTYARRGALAGAALGIGVVILNYRLSKGDRGDYIVPGLILFVPAGAVAGGLVGALVGVAVDAHRRH